MTQYIINRIRITGSQTWVGVDVPKRELFMDRDGRHTVLADFRSNEAAEFIDEWIQLIGTKFSPARQVRNFWPF